MIATMDEQIRRMTILSKVLKEARELCDTHDDFTYFPNMDLYFNKILDVELSINNRLNEVMRMR